MGIKSGTLRRKFDEAMNKKILCKNGLLLSIAYYYKQNDNEKRDKLVSVLLKYDKQGKQDIIDTLQTITDEYIPSYIQADKFYQFVTNKEYKIYSSNFIPDKLLRFKADADNNQKKKYFSAKELKYYIWQNNFISFVLEKIGCNNIHESNNNHYIRCSNADGDNSTAITVFIDNPLLNVINETRANNRNSDLIGLVSYTKGFNYFDTVKYLHSILGLYDIDISKLNYDAAEMIDNTEYEKEQEEKRKAEYQKALARYIKLYNSGIKSITIDWLRESIVYKAIEKFDIRISNDNSYILIPIKNTDGEIVGINRRTTRTAEEIKLLGIPKYQLTSGFNKSDYIYGLYENGNTIKEKGYCVIFEGVKSVLQRATMQDNTGLSILGHCISDKQAEILSSLNLNEIVIAFDKDVSIEEIEFYCYKLIDYGCRNVSYIYDKDNLLDSKDSPTDKGNKIYTQLFDKRIAVNRL